jgi:hypothetical protein
MAILNVDETIADLEFQASKLSFLKNRYPDLKLKANKNGPWEFSSKLVNKNFTKFKFSPYIYGYYSYVVFKVFDELEFEHNGTKAKLIVSSMPLTSRFIELVSEAYEDANGKHIPPEKRNYQICFSDLKFKNVHKDIQEQVNDQALLVALDFVNKHTFAKVNPTGLDPRFKKLLIFS